MAGKDNRNAIGITELMEMRELFDSLGRIPHDEACWCWNDTMNRWELYRVLPIARTLIAYRSPDSGKVNWTRG